MKQVKAKIISNRMVGPECYHMALEAPPVARAIGPGQFIHVRCSDGREPFLRRPFSVHRIREKSFEILYKIVGKGTTALSERRSGESIDIIGPLGNGFDMELSAKRYPLSAILVAGGMGVAPLLALAERLAYSVERIADRKKKKNDIHVIIGAKTKSHILCGEEFERLGAEAMIATEDGSAGRKGLTTDLLNAIRYPLNAHIYACGPNVMLAEVARIAKARRVPCQVSLEERMACGVGVCLGCPVKIKGGGYKMVCKDGPVFNSEDIIW